MGEDHSRPVIRTENKINCFCLSDTSLVYQEVNKMIPWLKCYYNKVEREKNKKLENDWAIVNYLSNSTIESSSKTSLKISCSFCTTSSLVIIYSFVIKKSGVIDKLVNEYSFTNSSFTLFEDSSSKPKLS